MQMGSEPLKCMEVWGGVTPGEQVLTRPGLDIWVSSRRSGSAAAVLHFVSSCASGRITRMLLADLVAGRLEFSDVAAQFRDLLKQHVNRIQQVGCERSMGTLIADAVQGGGCAATMMATYFAPTRRLTVCNAGHPPPLLYRSACREWSVLPLSPNELSVPGADPTFLTASEYHRGSIQLGDADMALFYSDSLLECRTSSGMPMSVSGLLSRLGDLGGQDPAEQASQLLGNLEREHPDNLRDIDTAVVLCRQSDRTTTLRDNLLAPIRLFRSVGDKTRLR